MNSATLRGEAGPLKNFAVLLSHETVRNFAARRGPPILADVVKALLQFMRCYHVDSMTRHFDPSAMFVDLHPAAGKKGRLLIPLLSRSVRKFRWAA